MDRNRTSGFSMVELLVVITVIGIMATMAAPPLLEWTRSLKYRAVARTLISEMREARSRAVVTNREQEILVDVTGDGAVSFGGISYSMPINGYALLQGNYANNSSTWAPPTGLGDGKRTLTSDMSARARLLLKSGTTCTGTADMSFQFNADGSATPNYVCIFNPSLPAADQLQWKVGVRSGSSGRVEITRK